MEVRGSLIGKAQQRHLPLTDNRVRFPGPAPNSNRMHAVLTLGCNVVNVPALALAQVKRIMMKRFQKIALVIGFAATQFVTAAVPLTFAPGFESCVRNCGQISQVGKTMVVTLLDRAGKPFKVASVDLDPAATKAVVAANHENLPAQQIFTAAAAGGDITTRTISTTLQTPTETIVYLVTYFYVGGVLVDVKIQEHRFDKRKER
jgi:hypothetical protein